jgi:hypothetical protein
LSSPGQSESPYHESLSRPLAGVRSDLQRRH